MEHIADFIDQHEYIFPLLCSLIIVLLIAIIISLLLQMQRNEKKPATPSEKTPEEKRTLLTVAKEDLERQLAEAKKETAYWKGLHNKLTSDYATLETDYSETKEKLIIKTKECTNLKKQLKEQTPPKENNILLQKEPDATNPKCTEHLQQLQDYKSPKVFFDKLHVKNAFKKTAFKKSENTQKELENIFEAQFLELYTLRNTPVMTENESKMFQVICDEVCQPEYKKAYDGLIDVFPQMSLHSIFALTSRIKDKNEEEGINHYFSRKFISKSVDFLICRRIHNSIDYFHPILGIEIDGTSHSKEGQEDSDEIKNKIFKAAKLPLLRFPLPEDKCTEIEQKKLVQELRNYLLPPL